jgi:hypothetical protein
LLQLDITDGYAYFVWKGNLRIIRIDVSTGNVVGKPFGKKTGHYVEPKLTQKLLNAYYKRDGKLFKEEREKMSFVKSIFATSKNVFVIYGSPINSGPGIPFWLQKYSLDGQFINESKIVDHPNTKFYFNRGGNILFTLSKLSDSEGYFIRKYKYK